MPVDNSKLDEKPINIIEADKVIEQQEKTLDEAIERTNKASEFLDE
jgi:hypothetical protein